MAFNKRFADSLKGKEQELYTQLAQMPKDAQKQLISDLSDEDKNILKEVKAKQSNFSDNKAQNTNPALKFIQELGDGINVGMLPNDQSVVNAYNRRFSHSSPESPVFNTSKNIIKGGKFATELGVNLAANLIPMKGASTALGLLGKGTTNAIGGGLGKLFVDSVGYAGAADMGLISDEEAFQKTMDADPVIAGAFGAIGSGLETVAAPVMKSFSNQVAKLGAAKTLNNALNKTGTAISKNFGDNFKGAQGELKKAFDALDAERKVLFKEAGKLDNFDTEAYELIGDAVNQNISSKSYISSIKKLGSEEINNAIAAKFGVKSIDKVPEKVSPAQLFDMRQLIGASRANFDKSIKVSADTIYDRMSGRLHKTQFNKALTFYKDEFLAKTGNPEIDAEAAATSLFRQDPKAKFAQDSVFDFFNPSKSTATESQKLVSEALSNKAKKDVAKGQLGRLIASKNTSKGSFQVDNLDSETISKANEVLSGKFDDARTALENNPLRSPISFLKSLGKGGNKSFDNLFENAGANRTSKLDDFNFLAIEKELKKPIKGSTVTDNAANIVGDVNAEQNLQFTQNTADIQRRTNPVLGFKPGSEEPDDLVNMLNKLYGNSISRVLARGADGTANFLDVAGIPSAQALRSAFFTD